MNLTSATMDRVVSEAATQITQGAEIVFIYSGHGYSEQQQNYLVGVSEDGERYLDVVDMRSGSVLVNDVIERLAVNDPKRIVVIVNACSDEPLVPAASLRPARPDFDGIGSEILLLYSSSPRGVAYDVLSNEERRNPAILSAFTREFLEYAEYDLPLLEVFTKTRIGVEKLSSVTAAGTGAAGRQALQIPHVLYDSINGAFSLNQPLSAMEFLDTDWRKAPSACRASPAALEEALSLRGDQSWSSSEERAAMEACIVEAAAGEMGIQKYSFAEDGGGQVEVVQGAKDRVFQSGDVISRIMVYDDQNKRTDVLKLNDLEVFKSALASHAFKDGWSMRMYTKRDDWIFLTVQF